jgi:hypothetical protein
MTYRFILNRKTDKQQDKTVYMEEVSTIVRVTSDWVNQKETTLPVNQSELDFTCVNTRKIVAMWNTVTNTSQNT